MANGFGSLWIGASGLQSASNGLNTTANNLSNVNTEGYVREQVVYQDRGYVSTGLDASVSKQQSGLGVEVGTIVHARDIFLDKAYRTENGRYTFYSACSEAVQEIYTQLQESDGEKFEEAISDFYEAFAEFAKDPSDTVNQDLVLQKASLFLSRASAVEDGFEDYQTIINEKIKDDVDRINEIGESIVDLNKQIQSIEAAKKYSTTPIEQAMELRDKRDSLLDELSGLCRISYNEDANGIVHVEIEGVEFVDEVQCNEIGMKTDLLTGYITPYWTQLSDPDNDDYYQVFDMKNISAEQNSDLGEVKALLLSRGDHISSYQEFLGVSSYDYERGIGNSVIMNSQAELDTLIHEMVTTINDLFSPIDSMTSVYGSDVSEFNDNQDTTLYLDGSEAADNTVIYYKDADGNIITNGKTIKVDEDGNTTTIREAKVCDIYDAAVGDDENLPPREIFVRNGTDRYTTKVVTLYADEECTKALTDEDGNPVTMTIYEYNPEVINYTDAQGENHTVDVDDYTYTDGDNILDTSQSYSLNNLSVNEELVEQESLLGHMVNIERSQVDYTLGDLVEQMWSDENFSLNPSDTTPCSFQGFYVKWVGELATTGSVYSTTTTSLQGTTEQIESSRQGVIGVSSDEELTSMIKYQSAYNAASRYINVVNEMIEHLITSLGA